MVMDPTSGSKAPMPPPPGVPGSDFVATTSSSNPSGTSYYRYGTNGGIERWNGYLGAWMPDTDTGALAGDSSGGGGGGGGGGWGGGGGGGGGGSSGSYLAEFEKYYGVGNVPSDVVNTAMNEDWSALRIRSYALTHGASGPGAIAAIQTVQYAAASVFGSDKVGNISDDLYRSLAAEDQDPQYYVDYFVDMVGFEDVLDSPIAQGMIQTWMDMTGIPLTYTAKVKLQEILSRHGGATSAAVAEWEGWLPTTQSARNGNYGAKKRIETNDQFYNVLGREATQAELDATWNMDAYGRLEYIRKTDDYAEEYAFKPAGMSEATYQAKKASWTEAYYRAFGIDIGSLGLEAVEQYTPRSETAVTEANPTTGAVTPPTWKSLTNEAFANELAKYNIKKISGTWYHYFEDGSREEISYQDIIKFLPAGEFYYDEQGYHYVQEEGALNPTTGQPATVTKPAVVAEEPGGPVSFAPEVPAAFLDTMINSGIDPEFWLTSIGWGEDAVVLEAQYGAALSKIGVSFSERDWYNLASGAIGSGALRAQIIEAQNKTAFEEVYRDYNGTSPTAADYDYLMSNFVSPTEYAHRMAAKEYAAEKIDEVNEILGRTLGQSVSSADLENLAMGGKGSGALKAKLNQAVRLDAFTWTFKQRTGREPSPEEYKEFLGYTGPEELAWNLDLVEAMAEQAPDIKEVWNEYYKDTPISDEQIRILLGDMVGSGELKYKLKEAKEYATEQERRDYYRWQSERANTEVRQSAQGGFQIATPGIGVIQ